MTANGFDFYDAFQIFIHLALFILVLVAFIEYRKINLKKLAVCLVVCSIVFSIKILITMFVSLSFAAVKLEKNIESAQCTHRHPLHREPIISSSQVNTSIKCQIV